MLYEPKIVNNNFTARNRFPDFAEWSVDTNWADPRTGDGQFNLVRWGIPSGSARLSETSEALCCEFEITNPILLNANFRYSTETYSFGSYEIYINGMFVKSGFFIKTRQLIWHATSTSVPAQVFLISNPAPLIQDCLDKNYTVPTRLTNPNLDFPVLIRAAYTTLYYRLNAGCRMFIRGWID